LAKTADPPLKWLCIEASAIDSIDYSAADTLVSLRASLEANGTRLVFLHLTRETQTELGERLESIAPADCRFATGARLLDAYRNEQ
jgi:MFS superfamily sulfate permease-like transporter